VVTDALVRHVEGFPPAEVEIDDETEPNRPVQRKVLLLFTDARGKPLLRDTFNEQVWRPACRRAGAALEDRAAGEPDTEAAESLRRQAAAMAEVTMHDLRHFFASALIRAGLNPKVVAERLGHANAAMTLNVYAHLWPDDEDRSRQAVDEALGASPTNVPTVRPRRGPRKRLPRSEA
jgi:integrase